MAEEQECEKCNLQITVTVCCFAGADEDRTKPKKASACQRAITSDDIRTFLKDNVGIYYVYKQEKTSSTRCPKCLRVIMHKLFKSNEDEEVPRDPAGELFLWSLLQLKEDIGVPMWFWARTREPLSAALFAQRVLEKIALLPGKKRKESSYEQGMLKAHARLFECLSKKRLDKYFFDLEFQSACMCPKDMSPPQYNVVNRPTAQERLKRSRKKFNDLQNMHTQNSQKDVPAGISTGIDTIGPMENQDGVNNEDEMTPERQRHVMRKKTTKMLVSRSDNWKMSPFLLALEVNNVDIISHEASWPKIRQVWAKGNKNILLPKLTKYRHALHILQRLAWPRLSYLVHMLFSVIFLILCSGIMLTNFQSRPLYHKDTKVVLGTEVYLLLHVLGLTVEEFREMLHTRKRKQAYIRNAWNWLQVFSILTYFIGFILQHCQSDNCFEAARIIRAISLMAFFYQFLECMSITSFWGKLIPMLEELIIQLVQFMCVVLLFVAAYAIAISAIINPNLPLDGDILANVFEAPVQLLFGNFSSPMTNELQVNWTTTTFPVQGTLEWVAPIIFSGHMIFTNILLLNVLIALFSNTVTKIEERADLYWRIQFFKLTVVYYHHSLLPPPVAIFSFLSFFSDPRPRNPFNCKRRLGNPDDDYYEPLVESKYLENIPKEDIINQNLALTWEVLDDEDSDDFKEYYDKYWKNIDRNKVTYVKRSDKRNSSSSNEAEQPHSSNTKPLEGKSTKDTTSSKNIAGLTDVKELPNNSDLKNTPTPTDGSSFKGRKFVKGSKKDEKLPEVEVVKDSRISTEDGGHTSHLTSEVLLTQTSISLQEIHQNLNNLKILMEPVSLLEDRFTEITQRLNTLSETKASPEPKESKKIKKYLNGLEEKLEQLRESIPSLKSNAILNPSEEKVVDRNEMPLESSAIEDIKKRLSAMNEKLGNNRDKAHTDSKKLISTIEKEKEKITADLNKSLTTLTQKVQEIETQLQQTEERITNSIYELPSTSTSRAPRHGSKSKRNVRYCIRRRYPFYPFRPPRGYNVYDCEHIKGGVLTTKSVVAAKSIEDVMNNIAHDQRPLPFPRSHTDF